MFFYDINIHPNNMARLETDTPSLWDAPDSMLAPLIVGHMHT
jgi:hypothetical protein